MTREAWVSALIISAILWSIGTLSLVILRELVAEPIGYHQR